MFLPFLDHLRREGVPVSLREFLTFLQALEVGLTTWDTEGFYHLARAAMVKDERHLDRFDRAFSAAFKGLEAISTDDVFEALDLPADWLTRLVEKRLTEEERAAIQALGGFDKLMETLRKRLEEQKGRHQGGNKWVGTAGTSPFGAYGYNPEGVRIGQDQSRHQRAVKVWDKREVRNLDDQVELGTRNIKIALRRLRKFARQGAAEELDIDGTIDHTARDAGLLNIQMRPERRNTIKLLLLFDIGGSMDAHVKICEELFSACKTEFKHLEYFYFHNFVYESVWKNNQRRTSERTSTQDLLHKYGADYKVIFIGDAAMAPYEITQAGGSVEHWNEEPGYVWMQRFMAKYKKLIWINPYPKDTWGYTASTGIVRELVEDQMYPLTLRGLEEGMRFLSK